MPLGEGIGSRDIVVGQLQAQNSRPRQLSNQPPNATSSSNTDLQGRPSLPSHPIGSLQLTNRVPSALPFVAERDQVPVSGSARSLSQELSPELSFPLQPYSFSAFPFLAPLYHHLPFPTPTSDVYTQEKAGRRGGGAAGSA